VTVASATAAASASGERILVIKLGALGDFALAMGPFAAIRHHHANARITLLTIPSLVELAKACGYFDEIWTDSRPRLWNARGWLGLARRLNEGNFDRVYDLQTSDRSSFYYRLMSPPFGKKRPEWSGIARGASHFHTNPKRDFMHTIERQKEQLALAGITDVPLPDLSWVRSDVSQFRLRPPYVLLVPGSSPHRPDKRWPDVRFTQLAVELLEHGFQPVLIGSEAERHVIDSIHDRVPDARDLCGRTSYFDIIGLARGAAGAVGNDTGPMHLIAAAGCRTVVLFSGASDPSLCAPRGPSPDRVTVLRRPSLADLPVADVLAAVTAT
jgi:ADP-heptose:LPS heptosyltransferase